MCLRSSGGSAWKLKWTCVARAAAAAGDAAAAGIDDRLDVGDAFDALRGPSARRNASSSVPASDVPSGASEVNRPLAHVLVGHELAADQAIQRERQQEDDQGDAAG